MTREEAILLSAYTGFLLAPDFSEVHKFCEDTLGRPIWTHEFADRCVQKEIQEKLRPQIMELVQNISALRPVSWEQVERIWFREPYTRLGTKYGENGDIVYYAVNTCMACGHETPIGNFCHNCGVAQTRAAVDMVMERMEALKDGKGD